MITALTLENTSMSFVTRSTVCGRNSKQSARDSIHWIKRLQRWRLRMSACPSEFARLHLVEILKSQHYSHFMQEIEWRADFWECLHVLLYWLNCVWWTFSNATSLLNFPYKITTALTWGYLHVIFNSIHCIWWTFWNITSLLNFTVYNDHSVDFWERLRVHVHSQELTLEKTALSREDETRNGHWYAKRNPRWSSQVSFQMAHLKRDVNFDAGLFSNGSFEKRPELWPWRISICISTSISSLIFSGTGCICVSFEFAPLYLVNILKRHLTTQFHCIQWPQRWLLRTSACPLNVLDCIWWTFSNVTSLLTSLYAGLTFKNVCVSVLICSTLSKRHSQKSASYSCHKVI